MDALRQHLIELEAELHHHGILCPPNRLPVLLHPDFHEVGRSGIPYSRDTVIRYLSSCQAVPPTASFRHTLHKIGEQQALLCYASSSPTESGEPLNTWRSSIWVAGTDGWQLIYHQATPAEPASFPQPLSDGLLSSSDLHKVPANPSP